MFGSLLNAFSSRSWGAALAGALGGLLSFPVGEWMHRIIGMSDQTALWEALRDAALWSGAIGLTLGAIILIFDNARSLRGRWHRDLLVGLPVLFLLSFCGGGAGQFAYAWIQNPLTRGLGWALMGLGIGAGVGALRRDILQAARGATGGAVGGFIGGFLFDFIGEALGSLGSGGDGELSRLVGQIILGALIAFLMRLVQESFKSAWLLGISTGPYEGKEYALSTARVSVGRADSNAIALFREPDLPAEIGALVFAGSHWAWQGHAVPINDAPHSNAPLQDGDVLQLGATRFRFRTRSSHAPPIIATDTNAPAASVATTSALNIAPSITDRPGARPRNLPRPAPTWALVGSDGTAFDLHSATPIVTIGRASDNAITLGDVGVSSRHARLNWRDDAWHLTDLGSTNGTWIGARQLEPNAPAPLREGDKVRLGRLEFRVERA